jgi:hypothetical protein
MELAWGLATQNTAHCQLNTEIIDLVSVRLTPNGSAQLAEARTFNGEKLNQ